MATVEGLKEVLGGVSEESRAMIEIEQQRAVAEAQSAMVIAKRFPRDPLKAMDNIVQSCTRPALAEAAVYQYARGGSNIEGPSIRLAEVLAQNWGNIRCGIIEATRRAGESECIAYAWDLETNFYDEKRFTVRHVRDTKKGSYALTDERDIYELTANMGSRRKRACILAVIPGDVVEAALRQCEVTLNTKAEVTEERIQSLKAKFLEFGVLPDAIEKRIQRHLDAITPALMVQLGKIYNSLKDGMSQPADWFEFAPVKEEKAAKTGGGSEEERTRIVITSGGAGGGKEEKTTTKGKSKAASTRIPEEENVSKQTGKTTDGAEPTGRTQAAGGAPKPSPNMQFTGVQAFNEAYQLIKQKEYALAHDLVRYMDERDTIIIKDLLQKAGYEG